MRKVRDRGVVGDGMNMWTGGWCQTSGTYSLDIRYPHLDLRSKSEVSSRSLLIC